jgi:hypothetical protein
MMTLKRIGEPWCSESGCTLPEHRMLECATPGCERPGRYIAVSEAAQGSSAPTRCVECCDLIERGFLNP